MMHSTPTAPLITSLLDTDAYKLHMQQAVFHHYPDAHVTAEFYHRDQGELGQYADDIRYQIEQLGTLTLSAEERAYLSRLPFFRADYLDWLARYRFDPASVTVLNERGALKIRISGPWREVILWEVPLLALISEIIHRHRSPDVTVDQAVAQLRKRIATFRAQSTGLDLSGFQLIDFGTRRRFSHAVQEAIVRCLQQEFPWLIGTSNYDLARRLNLAPLGTQAHEWFQAHQQLSPVLADCQRMALQSWLEEYPDQLGIALTDCISTEAFLRDFDRAFATRYQGLRHDSGDPYLWGEKAIAHYEKLGIDPRSKTLVFSDSLDLDKALALYRHFYPRVRTAFGVGTRLTCDIPGVTPLNIVIKLTECNYGPVAKLSDSPGKTVCRDQVFLRVLRQTFALPAPHPLC